ncbi:MAG: ATP-dependent zinc metalloprotease FtsH [Kiritimatiellae bacterium]|nr:ATP-dependent zinc metalloprotease FtsH [Kiritimatiellia bacterium]
MSDENQNYQKDPGPPDEKPDGEEQPNLRRTAHQSEHPGRRNPVTAWAAVALVSVFLLGLFFYKPGKDDSVLDQLAFRKMIEAGEVKKVELVRDSDGETYLRGIKKGKPETPFRVNVMPSDNLEKFLLEKNVTCPLVYNNNMFGSFMREILWILIPFGILYFLFFRMIRGSNMGASEFGKSRARLLQQDKKKVTFADVAGVKEAKEEVSEMVDFLKDPKKFQRLGGKIPKGVLLMGPPGTGKTLLAKAIAGEAGVPFFSISGSDFVEMFVGVGASRVRDMFEQGKKNAPCIIFIDEIDAVGRSRFSGIGGGHDEREQTLNAMLVEMDGFEGASGVIVIAATNRPDVLDPALLRPGRFDRQVMVDLPTVEGREEILKIHSAKVPLDDDVDLSRIARGTGGFSGADLANLMNEAALTAARRNQRKVHHSDLEEARDKVRWGRERKSLVMDDEERQSTAWHEAGHAILQVLCEHCDPLHKVTIIPRGRALGLTASLPEKDVFNYSRKQMQDLMVVCCGGRIGEELFTHDYSTGAAADIKQATDLARQMVCRYGMTEEFGFQAFGTNEETLFVGRELTRSQSYSEDTSRRIDEVVSKMLAEAYRRAEEIINANRDKLELLVKALLEYETLDGREAEELIKNGVMPERKIPPKVEPETAPAGDAADAGETAEAAKTEPVEHEVETP